MRRDRTGRERFGTRRYLKHKHRTSARCVLVTGDGDAAAIVHTCAVPLVGRESESVVAPTPKAADGISAGAVGAQTTENLTLVHI